MLIEEFDSMNNFSEYQIVANMNRTNNNLEEKQVTRNYKAISSCLKSTSPSKILIVNDCDVIEHSDEEWYPPTPPPYDVTDKLRSVETRIIYLYF